MGYGVLEVSEKCDIISLPFLKLHQVTVSLVCCGGKEPHEEWSQHPGVRTLELHKGDDSEESGSEEGLSGLKQTGWSEISHGGPKSCGGKGAMLKGAGL